MTRKAFMKAALPSLALTVGPLSAARAADTIKPGYWEAREEVLSPIHSLKVERRCVTRQQVAKFMTCYINHHYRCSCPEQSARAGIVTFKGQCVDNKGQTVGVEGHGAYTRTTLSLDASVTFRLLGIPLSGEAVTDAHRIGDICPADVK